MTGEGKTREGSGEVQPAALYSFSMAPGHGLPGIRLQRPASVSPKTLVEEARALGVGPPRLDVAQRFCALDAGPSEEVSQWVEIDPDAPIGIPTSPSPVLYGALHGESTMWWWVATGRSTPPRRYPMEYMLRAGRLLGTASRRASSARVGESVKDIVSNITGGGQMWDCWWGDTLLHYDLPLDEWGYFIPPKVDNKLVKPVLDLRLRVGTGVPDGHCCLYTNLGGRTTMFRVYKEDTVQLLRGKVAVWCGEESGEIILYHGGKELQTGGSCATTN